MAEYSTREVAELLDWPPSRVRGFVRDGLVNPIKQGRNLAFGFQDLVTLRAADELLRKGVAARNIRSGLRLLRHALPNGRPLSAMRLSAAGNRLVVREDGMLWEPQTGQAQLDFDQGLVAVPVSQLTSVEVNSDGSSDDWYHAGLAQEHSGEVAEAENAYRMSIERNPDHADAHINLGRLKQQQHHLAEAETLYRRALDLDSDNAIAHFNLGTLLEERGQQQAAIGHYNKAAPRLPDAHYNLARLFELLGDRQAAIRHLRALRMLWS